MSLSVWVSEFVIITVYSLVTVRLLSIHMSVWNESSKPLRGDLYSISRSREKYIPARAKAGEP